MVETFLVPTLPRPVRIRIGPCPDEVLVQGCHIAKEHIDTIWLDPSTGGVDTETTAHEMGHVFESYMWDLRWEQRRATAFVPKIFGRIAFILFGNFGPDTLESTIWAEQFAESYSACARFSTLSEPISGFYGFTMTPEQHDLICPLIDEMGRKYDEVSTSRPEVSSSGPVVPSSTTIRSVRDAQRTRHRDRPQAVAGSFTSVRRMLFPEGSRKPESMP